MNNLSTIQGQLENVNYIDAHIHMDEMPERTLSSEVLYLSNSMDEESYKKNLEISRINKNVIPTFGIHPEKALNYDSPKKEWESQIQQSLFVGEIGLDFYWITDSSTYHIQKMIFEHILLLSARYGTIPSIHTKGAEKVVLELLTKYSVKKAIIHWYSGPVDLIPAYIKRGCFFTVGPDLLANSDIHSFIPIERILLETDNPSGIPWILGQKADARDIIRIYHEFSKKRGISKIDLQNQIKKTFKELLEF